MENVEVIWGIKHQSISASFVDAGAAEFFLPYLERKKDPEGLSKRRKYTTTDPAASSSICGLQSATGSALGPDWANEVELKGSRKVRDHTVKFRV